LRLTLTKTSSWYPKPAILNIFELKKTYFIVTFNVFIYQASYRGLVSGFFHGDTTNTSSSIFACLRGRGSNCSRMLAVGSLVTMSKVSACNRGTIWLNDRCRLEYTCCLRKDVAIQAGTNNKCNVSLDQKDSLHVCTSPHAEISCDLPADILCLSGPRQGNFLVRGYRQGPRHLNVEDVIGCAKDGDARAEGVYAWRQSLSTDFAGSDIDPVGVLVGVASGVSVRDPHFTYRDSQKRWSVTGVARSVGCACDLIGRRRRSIRGHGQAEAGNCCRVDGSDFGLWRGGDATPRKDRVVFGSAEVDRVRLGIC